LGVGLAGAMRNFGAPHTTYCRFVIAAGHVLAVYMILESPASLVAYGRYGRGKPGIAASVSDGIVDRPPGVV
jgi:hypothetical protein